MYARSSFIGSKRVFGSTGNLFLSAVHRNWWKIAFFFALHRALSCSSCRYHWCWSRNLDQTLVCGLQHEVNTFNGDWIKAAWGVMMLPLWGGRLRTALLLLGLNSLPRSTGYCKRVGKARLDGGVCVQMGNQSSWTYLNMNGRFPLTPENVWGQKLFHVVYNDAFFCHKSQSIPCEVQLIYSISTTGSQLVVLGEAAYATLGANHTSGVVCRCMKTRNLSPELGLCSYLISIPQSLK